MRFFGFSAIVQGGDHIDRLIHRATLVADDSAVSDQHVPATPECLGVCCVNDAAFHAQLYAAVRHDRLHCCTSLKPSTAVQPHDRTQRFVFRLAVVADDFAAACQHPAAEVVGLAVRCNQEIAAAIHRHA